MDPKMAKLAITSIIFASFFFSYSESRSSPDLINIKELTKAILLPTTEQEIDTSKVNLPQNKTAESVNDTSHAMNKLYLNKHKFAVGVPLRRSRRGQVMQMNPATGDIVVSGGGDVVYPNMIPVRLHRHQSGGNVEDFRSFKHETTAKDKYEKIFRHEPKKESEEKEKEIENDQRKRPDFVNRVRKFLITK